jgi:excisionase family DNA binding protein
MSQLLTHLNIVPYDFNDTTKIHNNQQGETKMTQNVLTPEEVAKELGCSRGLVYRQIRAGVIPAVRLGDRYLISRLALDKMLSGEPNTPVIRVK